VMGTIATTARQPILACLLPGRISQQAF
jgi:hypothetical protein